MAADAWLVIAADGFRAVFLEHAVALNYAARCHGTVHALGIIKEASDATAAASS